jgi:hypothetical protein
VTGKVKEDEMKSLSAIIGSLLLLGVAAFCVFGLLATFEPTNRPGQFTAFRIGYLVIGLGCLVGMGFVIGNLLRK